MAMTVAELQQKGATELKEWLKQTNSRDAVVGLAVTQIAFAQQMGIFLDLQKQDLDTITADIKYNNETLSLLRKFSRETSKGSDNKEYKDLSKADVVALNERLGKALGKDFTPEQVPATDTGTTRVMKDKLDNYLSAAVTYGDQLTSTSQLKQSNLQTTITRYNQAFDLVTSLLKKWSDMQMNTTGNIRP